MSDLCFPSRLDALAACVAGFFISTAAMSASGGVLYVDDDAALGGDGRSWTSAFRHFQDALTFARIFPEVQEMRLARGTYRPDQGSGMTPGDRSATFNLVSGIAVRGGYAGLTGPDPDVRDILSNRTVLSGDLLEDDGPNFKNYGDNAYRVASVIDAGIGTMLEGVEQCVFERNTAYRGGGIGAAGTDLYIARSKFISNRAINGGGIGMHQSIDGTSARLYVEDTTFASNDTVFYGGDGAAIHLIGFGSIQSCRFENNVADDGAISLWSETVKVTDCLFRENRGDYFGAAHRSGTYVRCLFDRNSASVSGGAYGEQTSNPAFHARFFDCVFIGNWTESQGGGATYGGQTFVNCRFLDNQTALDFGAPFGPGGAILARVPTLIVDCEFDRNHARGVGGAISAASGVPVSVTNSTFASNLSDAAGSAINGPATICNSVFGPHPGPAANLLSGVTSVDYSCLPVPWTGEGGAGNIVAADPKFMNPLGRDGIAGTIDDDLRLRPDSPCIDAGDSTALPPDTFDIDGDGDTDEPLPLDLGGNARILETPATSNTGVPPATGGSAIIDMGANEYRRPADVWPSIGDGVVGLADLLLVIANWGPCPSSTSSVSTGSWESGRGCPGDTNEDDTVNVHDLLTVVLNWG